MIRRAALSGLTAIFLVSGLSVAAAPERPTGALEAARLVDAMPLEGKLFHVQGLALNSTRIWVTSVDRWEKRGYIHEFERATGRLLRQRELTDGARYHPGGIALAHGVIWVPVAEMRPDSSSMLVQLDVQSLEPRRTIAVSDHLGCVAVDGTTLVAGNWDSRTLHVFDLADEAATGPLRSITNPSPTRHQDMLFAGGMLVAGGHRTPWSGTVDWIDWESMELARSLDAGSVGTIRPLGNGGPLTGEGMTIEGNDLYFVAEDGPSRLLRYRLD